MLSELYLQTQAALHNLDANDLHLKQILQTSRRTKGQQEAVTAQETLDLGWVGIIFGGGSVNLRRPVEKAISNLKALIDQSSTAREVVGQLSYDVQKLSIGIEAARKYSDGMMAVEMTLDSEVEVMVAVKRSLSLSLQMVVNLVYVQDCCQYLIYHISPIFIIQHS